MLIAPAIAGEICLMCALSCWFKLSKSLPGWAASQRKAAWFVPKGSKIYPGG